jgi:diguanylate cyclase (GGDEF)-like protein
MTRRTTNAGERDGTSTTQSLMDSVADTTSHRDRDSLHSSVARLLFDFLDTKSVTIYRIVKDDGVVRLASLIAIRGNEEVLAERQDDPSTLPALIDEPLWNDCVRQYRVVQYSQTDSEFAIFPIGSEREVIGLMVIAGVNELQDRDIHLVSAILRVLKNHLELLDYGERDTLTHMLNRKTFESRFAKLRERLLAAKPQAAESCWLGLVDIDKFKSINDSHGHLFGDEVLLLMSQRMRECFRGADQLFRFGGEEFVIVLDHATTGGAEIAFDRLRAAVEAFNFPQVGRVTISLGYSRITSDDGPTTCVERADAALYYAKHHGRNRVCNFEALVAAGELVAKSQGEDAELF